VRRWGRGGRKKSQNVETSKRRNEEDGISRDQNPKRKRGADQTQKRSDWGFDI
jgi:hypothetical protein